MSKSSERAAEKASITPYSLVLRSLKAIRKEAAIMAMVLGRTSPDPRVGSPVELSGGDPRGLLNLIGVGKALSSQGIAAEEAPPALRAALSQQAPVGMKT